MRLILGFFSLYRFIGISILSVLILILLIEVTLNLFYHFYDDQKLIEKERILRIEEADRIMSKIPLANPHLNSEEIKQLIKETWHRGTFHYDLYCQFREPENKGIYVNVSPNGYRKVENQGPWPPDKKNINIFVFGGSTTFGYGVSDEETIPSILQKKFHNSKTPISVYNFGRGYFYSTQELMLFTRLVSSGMNIDYAIFIDGLNDLWHADREPILTGHLEDTLIPKRSIFHQEPLIGMNISRVMRGIIRRSDSIRSKSQQKYKLSNSKPKNQIISNAVEKYFRNIRCIKGVGHSFNIKTFMILQPVPSYYYNLKYHLFVDHKNPDFQHHIYLTEGYPLLASKFRALEGNNFIDLSRIQEDLNENLYVDTVHYNKVLNGIIAEKIFCEVNPNINLSN